MHRRRISNRRLDFRAAELGGRSGAWRGVAALDREASCAQAGAEITRHRAGAARSLLPSLIPAYAGPGVASRVQNRTASPPPIHASDLIEAVADADVLHKSSAARIFLALVLRRQRCRGGDPGESATRRGGCLDIEGYPSGSRRASRPASDDGWRLLAMGSTALASRHHASKRPPLMGFEPTGTGANPAWTRWPVRCVIAARVDGSRRWCRFRCSKARSAGCCCWWCERPRATQASEFRDARGSMAADLPVRRWRVRAGRARLRPGPSTVLVQGPRHRRPDGWRERQRHAEADG